MLSTLNQTTAQAYGRFLSDQELQGLQAYVNSFQVRRQAYQLLSQNSETLVIAALKQLAATHYQEVKTYSTKCKRDMDYALKEIAKAVLMDGEEVFKQGFSLWMENITRAVHRGNSAAQAYAYLKAEIIKTMPEDCAALVVPYVDDLIMSFGG